MAHSINGLAERLVSTCTARALCRRARSRASITSGFLPSAEIRKTGLAAAIVGLQIISSGVEGRDTLPVYVSWRLHSSDATVKDPPDPTPMTLDSLAPAIAALI